MNLKRCDGYSIPRDAHSRFTIRYHANGNCSAAIALVTADFDTPSEVAKFFRPIALQICSMFFIHQDLVHYLCTVNTHKEDTFTYYVQRR